MGASQWVTAGSGRVVQKARVVRERVLRALFARNGLRRVVNGIPMRIGPTHRWQFLRDYDAPVAEYLRRRIQPGDSCLSIGANVGIYPIQMAAWSGPNGLVYAFEPNPRTAEVLGAHVRMNHLEDRVRIIQKAVSVAVGTERFHAEGTEGMSRLRAPNPLLAGRGGFIDVAVTTLDDFCSKSEVTPAAIMMDIEGFEVLALEGASRLLSTRRLSAAVIEVHPDGWRDAGTTKSDFERLLRLYQLRAVALSGQKDPLAEYGHVALEPLV